MFYYVQDVMRHTYASYHAKHFRNFTELQYEMGHSGLHLLKSRYLNMQDISRKDASRSGTSGNPHHTGRPFEPITHFRLLKRHGFRHNKGRHVERQIF